MARPVSVSRFSRCKFRSHVGCVLVAQIADDPFQIGRHVVIQSHHGHRGF
jgi:hypothetical protein